MNTNAIVSRQGAKAQRRTVEPSWLRCRIPALCVFAPLREITTIALLSIALLSPYASALAQTTTPPDSTTTRSQTALSPYLDQTTGLTADDAVRYALANNGELEAARKEI